MYYSGIMPVELNTYISIRNLNLQLYIPNKATRMKLKEKMFKCFQSAEFYNFINLHLLANPVAIDDIFKYNICKWLPSIHQTQLHEYSYNVHV